MRRGDGWNRPSPWHRKEPSMQKKSTRPCLHCGAPCKQRTRTFCSQSCARKNSARPIEERFWKRVDKNGECWNWTHRKTRDGYGYVKKFNTVTGRWSYTYVHRLSWELANGPIPDGLFVCHHCDNPSCVRPSHLFVGTHLDNMKDRSAKGRTRRSSKLKVDGNQSP